MQEERSRRLDSAPSAPYRSPPTVSKPIRRASTLRPGETVFPNGHGVSGQYTQFMKSATGLARSGIQFPGMYTESDAERFPKTLRCNSRTVPTAADAPKNLEAEYHQKGYLRVGENVEPRCRERAGHRCPGYHDNINDI